MVDSRKGWVIFLLCAINAVYMYTKYRAGDLKILGMNISDIEIPKVVCFSPLALAEPMGQLFVSTLIILILCTTAQYARYGIKAFICDSFIQTLLREAVAAAELCGCCFELIIVADNFGVFMYSLYLFLLTIWWNKSWEDATGCPYTHLEDVVQGRQELQSALMKVWAQLTGGIFVFRLIQIIWNLEIVETHEDRAYEECSADLQIPILPGVLVEAAGTFFCQITGKILADLNSKRGDIIGPFLATSAVAAAFNFTGGYYNPVLATSLKFGCKGNTFIEHMIVYWVGACFGSLASVWLYERTSLTNYFRKKRTNDDDTKNYWEREKEE